MIKCTKCTNRAKFFALWPFPNHKIIFFYFLQQSVQNVQSGQKSFYYDHFWIRKFLVFISCDKVYKMYKQSKSLCTMTISESENSWFLFFVTKCSKCTKKAKVYDHFWIRKFLVFISCDKVYKIYKENKSLCTIIISDSEFLVFTSCDKVYKMYK